MTVSLKNNNTKSILKAELWKELGRSMLLSALVYALLFAVLYGVESLFPSLHHRLLTWYTPDKSLDWAFLVGIPASIIGTGYVLAIRNPQNYTGFYMGIVMSLLLAFQLYLQGSYDLVCLYLFVFVPFMIASVVKWRKAALAVTEKEKVEPFVPEFLKPTKQLLVRGVALLIIVADYIFVTLCINHDAWTDLLLTKLAGAVLIASAVLANFLLIYKKNDAWICWGIYCLTGILLFTVLGNAFSVVMFVTMLIVNLSAQIAWLKQTPGLRFYHNSNRGFSPINSELNT